MRAFAFLSLATAALAIPVVVPGPAVADVVAPVFVPVKAAVGAVAHAHTNTNANAGNVEANYNNVADNDVNNNKVHVLRGVNVEHAGVSKVVDVNAKHPAVGVASEVVHPRDVANVYAPIVIILKALVAFAASVGVDAEAAIANIDLDYNDILNCVANNNDINVGKRGDVNVLAEILAAIFACVRALIAAGVSANAIIGNVTATWNNIANNVGNGNTVNVASRGLVNVIAPFAAVINAIIPILLKAYAGITLDIVNIALGYNNIGNDVLNGNTVNLFSQ